MLAEQLAMVTDKDLQNELMSRYDHAIFHGRKDRPTPDLPAHYIKAWRQVGDAAVCIGMAFSMMCMCQNEIASSEVEADQDDL